MSMHSTILFLGATLVIMVVPGPSALFAFTRSLEGGLRAGMCAVAGLETGLAVHVFAATAGISGTIASSPVAFCALKVAGAGYLAFLGVRELTGLGRRDAAAGRRPTSGKGYARQFCDGVLVDLSNPKTLLFCLAFLPQFVAPGGESTAQQVTLLGVAVVAVAALVDGAYALSAGVARRRPASVATAQMLRRASGTAFLSLAALTWLG